MGWTNGTSTYDGEQFCQTSLKYIHDCKSCGTDEKTVFRTFFLNSCRY